MSQPSARSLHKDMKQRSKAAQDARQEFYDMVHFSDVFLLSIMFGFSVIGNMYPPQTRSQLLIGLSLYLGAFFIYLYIKAGEPPKKRRKGKKSTKEEDEAEKKDEKKPKEEKELKEAKEEK
ncbi:unnamed protein product [Cladocopium goreaui]|uniref:Uncharacterized protein n=1 Tax=Cladocopium goreaui TaxID=2562237 RepID=A0A9P1DA49_9DINO|nr:unnamed protein product [Cladocopium goreaui]|mmetsp:Transcript_63141/g.138252  ORF Transcript_63141/g.138252 Transcript_63141/m.138252 type:complete len:121 (+) Transcript_63141:51-413(+)